MVVLKFKFKANKKGVGKIISGLIQNITRLTHWRTYANFYPPERQLTKASEPSFDLEGGAQGQI